MPPTSRAGKSGFEKKIFLPDGPEEQNLIILRNGGRRGVPAEKWIGILFQFPELLK
jgi:hypothetical protein